MALHRTFRFELQLEHQVRLNFNGIGEKSTVAIIAHKGHAHWVAIKEAGNRIWLLDSTTHPRKLTFADYYHFVTRYHQRSNSFGHSELGFYLLGNDFVT